MDMDHPSGGQRVEVQHGVVDVDRHLEVAVAVQLDELRQIRHAHAAQPSEPAHLGVRLRVARHHQDRMSPIEQLEHGEPLAELVEPAGVVREVHDHLSRHGLARDPPSGGRNLGPHETPPQHVRVRPVSPQDTFPTTLRRGRFAWMSPRSGCCVVLAGLDQAVRAAVPPHTHKNHNFGPRGRGPTKQKTISAQTGEKVTVDVPRLNYRECLIPIRAFYLDLAQWAVDDPGRWAQWAVPCPIKEEGSLPHQGRRGQPANAPAPPQIPYGCPRRRGRAGSRRGAGPPARATTSGCSSRHG